MKRTPKIEDTIRTIFRALPDGLRLREPPTAKIEQNVLRQVFGPMESHMNAAFDNLDMSPSSRNSKK